MIALAMSEGVQTLKRALEAGQLYGRFMLKPLRIGHASVPSRVLGVTLGAPCKKGISVFFPTKDGPKGISLEVEEHHGKLAMAPAELFRKLGGILSEVEDSSIALRATTPPPPLENAGSAVAIKVPPKESVVSPPRYSNHGEKLRVAGLEQIAPILANVEEMRAFHEDMRNEAGRGKIQRQRITRLIKDRFGLTFGCAHRALFHALEARDIITPCWALPHRYQKNAPFSVSPLPLPVQKPDGASLVLVPPVHGLPTPNDDIPARIATLNARRDALRPAHEEFVAIEQELADIRSQIEQEIAKQEAILRSLRIGTY